MVPSEISYFYLGGCKIYVGWPVVLHRAHHTDAQPSHCGGTERRDTSDHAEPDSGIERGAGASERCELDDGDVRLVCVGPDSGLHVERSGAFDPDQRSERCFRVVHVLEDVRQSDVDACSCLDEVDVELVGDDIHVLPREWLRVPDSGFRDRDVQLVAASVVLPGDELWWPGDLDGAVLVTFLWVLDLRAGAAVQDVYGEDRCRASRADAGFPEQLLGWFEHGGFISGGVHHDDDESCGSVVGDDYEGVLRREHVCGECEEPYDRGIGEVHRVEQHRGEHASVRA